MSISDITKNFEYMYSGRGRHVGPSYDILDRPIKALMDLGGVVEHSYENDNTIGDTVETHHHESFSYIFKVIGFPGHRIKAFVTREESPNHPNSPAFLTRIRLGEYTNEDSFTEKVERALLRVPASD
jgi:hypothetical protein